MNFSFFDNPNIRDINYFENPTVCTPRRMVRKSDIYDQISLDEISDLEDISDMISDKLMETVDRQFARARQKIQETETENSYS